MTHLPIIDLRAPEREIAQQIADACRAHGFFNVVGHDVDQALALPMDKSRFVLVALIIAYVICSNAAERYYGPHAKHSLTAQVAHEIQRLLRHPWCRPHGERG